MTSSPFPNGGHLVCVLVVKHPTYFYLVLPQSLVRGVKSGEAFYNVLVENYFALLER